VNGEHKRKLQSIANTLNDNKLREVVMYGVGYHHAGLSTNDRKTIETMFTNGELPVLFSTSTLAMGVNLPAHLVIIKSTFHYVGGMFQEYTESQILQMIGRAGRPQFDSHATAVILTRNSTKHKYEELLNGTQVIESNLHTHLIEHFNAEIVLNTITDVSIALNWLKSTFLYIRIKKNPQYYNIPKGLSMDSLEDKLQEMCLKDLHLLESNGLVKMEDGFTLIPTEIGTLMARYYIAFQSMKRFINLNGNESLSELVDELSKCEEFTDVHLRVNEKRILNQLNKDKHRLTIRFPMSGKIKSTDMKVNCLIQSALGCLSIQEFTLNQDMQKILRSASRLCRCLMELVVIGENYTLLLNGVLLHKCIQAKLWENSKHVTKQLDKIGVALSTTIVNAGLTSFSKLLETNPREIELIVNRHPPFGNQIKEAVVKLPQYSLNIDQSSALAINQAEIQVTIVLNNHTTLKDTGTTAGPSHMCILIVGDEDNSVILKQKITDSQLLSSGRWSRKITIQQASKGIKLHFHYISLEYVGLDVHQSFIPEYIQPFKSSSKKPIQQQETTQQQKTTGCKSTTKVRQKECNHRCINKNVCGHECCKYGLSSVNKENDLPVNDNKVMKDVTTPSTRTKDMTVHVNELRHKVQSIPPTPGLKRIKVTSHSDDYRSYLTSTSLKDQYSYLPQVKLNHQNRDSSYPQYVDGDEYDEELMDLPADIDFTNDSDVSIASPPPLPPPLPQLVHHQSMITPSNDILHYPLPPTPSTTRSISNNNIKHSFHPQSTPYRPTPSRPTPSHKSPILKYTPPNDTLVHESTSSNSKQHQFNPLQTSHKPTPSVHSNKRMMINNHSSLPPHCDDYQFRPVKKLCQRNLHNELSHTEVQKLPLTGSNNISFFTSKAKTSPSVDDEDDDNGDLFRAVFADIF
jgi:ATP-dependent DNA helicase HFM1/MER3